jgi:hypothetical protein
LNRGSNRRTHAPRLRLLPYVSRLTTDPAPLRAGSERAVRRRCEGAGTNGEAATAAATMASSSAVPAPHGAFKVGREHRGAKGRSRAQANAGLGRPSRASPARHRPDIASVPSTRSGAALAPEGQRCAPPRRRRHKHGVHLRIRVALEGPPDGSSRRRKADPMQTFMQFEPGAEWEDLNRVFHVGRAAATSICLATESHAAAHASRGRVSNGLGRVHRPPP